MGAIKKMTARISKSLHTKTRTPRGLWCALWSVIAFWTGGSLPIWSNWAENGNSGSLWASVANLPRMDLTRLWDLYSGDVGRLVVLLVIAGGPFLYLRLTHQPKPADAADDYADGPSGAVADGRAESRPAPDVKW